MRKFAKLVLWTLVISLVPTLAFAAESGGDSATMSHLGYALGALATLWFFDRLPAIWGA